MIIFEIIDKKGKTIRLRKKQWQHILNEHPYMSGRVEQIKEVLLYPDSVEKSFFNSGVKLHYKYYKETAKYLLVAVKYLNGAAFVITAFYTKKFKRR